MATNKSSTSKNVEAYIKDTLARSKSGAAAAEAAGYPADSALTKAYYEGIPNLYMYGDAAQREALQKAGGLYDLYGAAGKYDKTQYGDLADLYRRAGVYNPQEYDMADYTAKNIQERMSPYEELVSGRAKERLKKAYDEGRGEREMQAIRAGAFGGSGQAIQEELARRNYLEQMADMNAQNLQSAFESGTNLYSKELADRLAAQQAEEASRQYGKGVEFQGIEGLMSARDKEAAQNAAAKEAEFTALGGQQESARQQALMAEQQKNLQLSNLGAMQTAGSQQQQTELAKQNRPLELANMQSGVLGNMSGPSQQAMSPSQGSSTAQNILGGLSAGAGILQGLGGLSGIRSMFADGGLVYRGGGLADLSAYSGYYQK